MEENEKAVYRRILRDLNAPPPRPSSTPSTTWSKAARVYPSSTLVEGLDISRWTTTIEYKYFDREKGKGLVAKEPISEGQTVWKEDPFEIYDVQLASRTCTHCITPLTNHYLASLINPASIPLLTFARKHVWMALHALAQCTARLLLAHQQKQGRQRVGISSHDGEEEEQGMRKDWRVYCTLADLGMEKRRPLPKEVADALFTYEGFLHGLGRMSLNLEAHGGLCTLHSHMNHSCNPNVSARHPDRRTALSRITVIAERDVAVGEELIVTYVDPSLGVCERRSQLVAWGFGQCYCERCVKEEREGRSCEDEGEGEIKERSCMDDLERELKAGLPVGHHITKTGAQWWWLTPMRCCITNGVGWSVMVIWRQRG
ncbi:SET domain containing protein [Russula decolorans]